MQAALRTRDPLFAYRLQYELEEEQRWRGRRRSRRGSVAERLRIRRAATDVRIFLTLQLSRDAAEQRSEHAAARDIQAHFRGHNYRREGLAEVPQPGGLAGRHRDLLQDEERRRR